MGEQPNPWDLSLPPLLVGQDYTFTIAFHVTMEAVGASRMIGLLSRILSHLPQLEVTAQDQSLRETNPWIIAAVF